MKHIKTRQEHYVIKPDNRDTVWITGWSLRGQNVVTVLNSMGAGEIQHCPWADRY